jgi:DNA polymerase-4
MAIILHLDFNSYFASVEQQANPFLRGRPIAVAGKGKNSIDVSGAHRWSGRFDVRHAKLNRTVITTASREAKKLGVKTAMASYQALKICPELQIIPGDPHKYSEITARFLAILRRHCDAVEQFSTDEAFADITTASGGDYFGATLLAQIIRSEVARECGAYCTASIGIAPNKLVAKLAGESRKPNGLTVVRKEDVSSFVLSRQLEDICGIGPRISEHLGRLGISSMASLRHAPLALLRREFKSYGDFLYAACRGQGDDRVVNSEAPPKSVGHSYTFPYNLDSAHEIRRNLLALCDKVAYRLRRDGLIATHISAFARYPDFGGVGGGHKIHEPINDGLDIFKNAWSILQRNLDVQRGTRLLGVSASGLFHCAAPRSLFPAAEKANRARLALDKLQARYGSGVWLRASTLGTVFKERVSGWHYDHEI